MIPDFAKYPDGLVPAIVQDNRTRVVLMLGYMNKAAYSKTLQTGLVTFFSRSRQELWVKGETSGNYLNLASILVDCDNDCLLIKANPQGPVCHTGADTCFEEANTGDHFLNELERVIASRQTEAPEGSYTASLFAKGINKIAQKVGEEAVELVIEAKDDNAELFKNEAADLLYHYLVLLRAKGFSMADIEDVLKSRH